jgi:polysaccharide biosynthesis protein VpsJ
VRERHDAERRWAGEAALAIWRRLKERDWAGHDPYDGCLATRVPAALTSSRVGRRVLTQAVKRSPVPLQPLLGVPAAVDPYTLGHALLACSRLTGLPDSADAKAEAGDLVRRLDDAAWTSGASAAWGYHFPVHTRFFSYVPPTPNLIVTAFVAKGLAAATRAGLVDGRERLRAAATFTLEHLERVSDDTGDCVGYVPGEKAAVHNANLLAALLLCEAAELCDEPAWRDQAVRCARFTVARQSPDGSWPYSEESYGRWVDGFHTGFVLEGLARVVRESDDAALAAALARGAGYYVAQLFGPDGEPKYYPDRPYPFDALSAAQGVETLMVALGGHAVGAVPGQLAWIHDHLVRSDGRVAYQVHSSWTDAREFPRWSAAPMLSALAGLAEARQ